jgi:hypothetical protein
MLDVLASAGRMTHSFFSAAASGQPNTGADTYACPRARCSRASSFDSGTLIVLVPMWNAPFRRTSIAAPLGGTGANIASRTAWSFASIVIAASAPSTVRCRFRHHRACLHQRLDSRMRAVEHPYLVSRPEQVEGRGRPMVPVPKNAIFTAASSLVISLYVEIRVAAEGLETAATTSEKGRTNRASVWSSASALTGTSNTVDFIRQAISTPTAWG